MVTAADAADAALRDLGYWNTGALVESIRLLLAALPGPPLPGGPADRLFQGVARAQGERRHGPRVSKPAPLDRVDRRETVAHPRYSHLPRRPPRPHGTDPPERGRAIVALEQVRDWINNLLDVTYLNAPWVKATEEGVHVDEEDQGRRSTRGSRRRSASTPRSARVPWRWHYRKRSQSAAVAHGSRDQISRSQTSRFSGALITRWSSPRSLS
mmetsp:Transcript_5171/g.15368  ORF Transcript_5171/g.15368 Transcript_5171/m.15368 type:complete len:212 (-) Transcript_5171:368-1003(-)